jgi:hypothetical protein
MQGIAPCPAGRDQGCLVADLRSPPTAPPGRPSVPSRGPAIHTGFSFPPFLVQVILVVDRFIATIHTSGGLIARLGVFCRKARSMRFIAAALLVCCAVTAFGQSYGNAGFGSGAYGNAGDHAGAYGNYTGGSGGGYPVPYSPTGNGNAQLVSPTGTYPPPPGVPLFDVSTRQGRLQLALYRQRQYVAQQLIPVYRMHRREPAWIESWNLIERYLAADEIIGPFQAENGDWLGIDNDGDGAPEPIYVAGYYQDDGYVRAHYRAVIEAE